MLRLDRISKSFGARVLFADVSYQFPQGERVALVGANGAGKTTLLNILCDSDRPDGGQILAPKQLRIGYLPQEPNPKPEATVLEECEAGASDLLALSREMAAATTALEAEGSDHTAAAAQFAAAEAAYAAAGGYSLSAQAHEILTGLGFGTDLLGRDPRALSGGWRMRLELARLFIKKPDFLILDEPTNHLDLPSLVWVEDYLQTFPGTLLFVSHDRALLNRLATMTLHLAGGRLTSYVGNFDTFLETKAARESQIESEREQLRRRREEMERFVSRFGAKATKAAQAQSRLKMIARLRAVEDTLDAGSDEAELVVSLPDPPKAPRIVLAVERAAIGYSPDRPLARGVSLEVERGAKIAIIGANGIGKSTLLKTIAGRLTPLSGSFNLGAGVQLAFVAQDQADTLDQNATILANVLRTTPLGEREARRLLGSFLFRGDDVFKEVGVLSGGEKSRVGLASAIATRTNLLLLDEPTNHLDMASVESLATALDAYEGTLLFVSHDRQFIDSVATHIFAMLPDGRSMLFPGRLDDYARLADIAGFPNVMRPVHADQGRQPETVSATPKAVDGPTEAELKELRRKRQRLKSRLEALDREMERWRRQLAHLQATLAAGGAYADLAKINQDLTQLTSRLEAHELEWLEKSEEAEFLVTELTRHGRL